jgi:hypothetical protein
LLTAFLLGQGKITAPLSANVNILSAFRHSQPAGTMLTSYWGSGKYVAEKGKWSRLFTRTLFLSAKNTFNR